MTSYRQPKYLTDRDEPGYRIRCPIHGFIRFSENERRIIDHPLFRRLRYIRQLALTEFVYPGATHTRFEHSLGVMEIATRAFDTLAAKRGDQMEAWLGQVTDLEAEPLAIARQVLRVAALLHDVGHAPFSHAAEAVTHRGDGHEALSVQIVREADLLGGELDSAFHAGFAERVAQVLEGAPRFPPQFQILRDLVAGQMDSDRTDYLLRDSHHCGVDYGRFDHRRLIECLDLQEDLTGALEIVLTWDGVHAFEALILARYQMNTQVYYHRLRRIYDRYLEFYFRALDDEAPDTPERVLSSNDITMMAKIMNDAENGTGDRRRWARRIRDRVHHRMVHETGVDADEIAVGHSRQLMARLKEIYPECDFIWDNAEGSIHKLLRPGDKRDTGLVRLAIVDPNRRSRQIGEVSQVLRYIPREFQCARIFADFTRDQRELQRAVVDRAGHEWRAVGGG